MFTFQACIYQLQVFCSIRRATTDVFYIFTEFYRSMKLFFMLEVIFLIQQAPSNSMAAIFVMMGPKQIVKNFRQTMICLSCL